MNLKTLHWHALVGYYFISFAASSLATIAGDYGGYLGYLSKTAVPNIRDEDEFGGECQWHRAGRRETKVCVHCLILPVKKKSGPL